MSDHVPDPGVPQAPPGPQSEPGAAHTEVFASAEFATGPGYGPQGGETNGEVPGEASGKVTGEVPGEASGKVTGELPSAVNGEVPGEMNGELPGESGAMPWGATAAAPATQPMATGAVPWGATSAEPGTQPMASGALPWGATAAAPGTQPPRRNRRAGWIIGISLGYAVLAAGTAFGVIGQKSPAAVDVTAVDASAYAAPVGSASASSGATAKASPSASQTTAAPTSAAPTTATPTSTVTGTVSDGTHHGDLRFFLLPPPQGPSSVQGDPDGTTESLSDVVTEYGGGSDVRSLLKEEGFSTACTRTYQDSTLGANVTIELLKFGSSSGASDWLSGFSFSGGGYQSISVPGESGARGWSYAKDGQYELVGVYRDGDTFFQVALFGTQLIPAADLGTVISAEHSRLAHG